MTFYLSEILLKRFYKNIHNVFLSIAGEVFLTGEAVKAVVDCNWLRYSAKILGRPAAMSRLSN